jgi:hypothetical protein
LLRFVESFGENLNKGLHLRDASDFREQRLPLKS